MRSLQSMNQMKSLSEYFLDESKEYTNEKELIDEIEAEILLE